LLHCNKQPFGSALIRVSKKIARHALKTIAHSKGFQ